MKDKQKSRLAFFLGEVFDIIWVFASGIWAGIAFVLSAVFAIKGRNLKKRNKPNE